MTLPLGLRLRRQRVRWARSLRRHLRGTGTVYVGERVEQYRTYWSEAAKALGAGFEPLTDCVWEVRRGAAATRITNYIVQLDDTVTNTLAGDKPFGYGIARGCGVPTPVHGCFTLERLDDARSFLESLDGPAVVKPARGSASALGVTTWVGNGRQLADAACLASLFCDEWIVESMHRGESCRLLMLDGELLHAVSRSGAGVAGDGSRPVRELRTVYDREVEPHPDLVDGARRIAAGFGARFAGVDFVTPDPEVALDACGGVFLELNTTPGIHHHDTDPGRRSLPVAVRVLSTLLEEAGEGRT